MRLIFEINFTQDDYEYYPANTAYNAGKICGK
jgi:hypothetical protein